LIAVARGILASGGGFAAVRILHRRAAQRLEEPRLGARFG